MNTGLFRQALTVLSPAGRRARLMIFSFHRVVGTHDLLSPTEPDVEQFQQMVSWIDSFCRVLPLVEAVDALRNGRLPARAAAITFDDGYRNNLMLAKPVLKAMGLPATVFIAVDAVRSGIMWNDLIIEAVRR